MSLLPNKSLRDLWNAFKDKLFPTPMPEPERVKNKGIKSLPFHK